MSPCDLAGLTPEKIELQLDENRYLLNRGLGISASHMTLVRPPFSCPWYNKTSDIVRAKAGNIILKKGDCHFVARHPSYHKNITAGNFQKT